MFDGTSRVLRDETTPRAIDTPLLGTNAVSQQTFFSKSGQTYELTGPWQTRPSRSGSRWRGQMRRESGGVQATGQRSQSVGDDRRTVVLGQRLCRAESRARWRVGMTLIIWRACSCPPAQTGTWSSRGAGPGYRRRLRSLNVKQSLVNEDFALVVYNGTNASDVATGQTNDMCQTALPIAAFPFAWTNTLAAPDVNAFPSPSAWAGRAERVF